MNTKNGRNRRRKHQLNKAVKAQRKAVSTQVAPKSLPAVADVSSEERPNGPEVMRIPTPIAAMVAKSQQLASRVHANSKSGVARLLTALCVLLAIGQVAIMCLLPTEQRFGSLPLQFRIDRDDLASLPIELGLVYSCGCWEGDSGQASKKMKFGLRNNWNRSLNIGGGKTSSVRLLVAYRSDFKPAQEVPVSDYTQYIQVATPPDMSMYSSDRTERVDPMRVDNGNKLFGIPQGFTLWGLVPSPNNVVRLYSDKGASFATVVDNEILNAGETYATPKLGHGAWVFPTPLPPDVAEEVGQHEMYGFPGEWEPVKIPDMAKVEKSMIIVGIAIFSALDNSGLVGFAPAPSHGLLLDPSAF